MIMRGMTRPFSDKKLHETNRHIFRGDKVQKKKVNELYLKRKG